MDVFLITIPYFLLALACRAEDNPAVPSRLRVRVEGRACAPVPLPSLADGEGYPLHVQIGELLTHEVPSPCTVKHFRLEGSGDWSRAACGLGVPLAAGGAGANLLLRSSCSHPATVTVEVGLFSSPKPTDPLIPSNTHLAAAALARERELLEELGDNATSILGPANNTQGDRAGSGSSGRSFADSQMNGTGALPQALSPSPTPPPPSSPPLTFNNMVCCCKNTSMVMDYVSPSPANCCCGHYRQCCIRDSMVTGLCHGSSMCSVIMVTGVVFFAGIICCIGAVVMWRRRAMARELRAAVAARSEQEAASARERPAPPPETLDPELEGKRVMPPTPEQMGASLECPVCLESLTVAPDNWVNFPCQHGSCMSCLQGMIRHNRRRRSQRHLLPCPLCRHLAVGRLSAPITEADLAPECPSSPNTGAGLAPGDPLPTADSLPMEHLSTSTATEGLTSTDSALSEATFMGGSPTAPPGPSTLLPEGADLAASLVEGSRSSGPGAANPAVGGPASEAGDPVRETELAARHSHH